jgi:hypothetical protein
VPEQPPLPDHLPPCPKCRSGAVRRTIDTTQGFYCLCSSCGDGWHHDRISSDTDKRFVLPPGGWVWPCEGLAARGKSASGSQSSQSTSPSVVAGVCVLPSPLCASAVSGNTPAREISPEERELQKEKAAEQEDLAKLSSNSRFVADPTSGHHIHLENSTLVVRAIREVVDAVRSKKPLAK